MLHCLVSAIVLVCFVPVAQEEDLVGETNRLFQEGNASEALDRLQDHVKAHPDDGVAWRLIGQGFALVADEMINAGEDPGMALVDAQDAFKKALALNPGDRDAVFGAMDAHYLLGEFEEAQSIALAAAGRIFLEEGEIPSWLLVSLSQTRAQLVMGTTPESLEEFTGTFVPGLNLVRNAVKQAPDQPLIVLAECDVLQWAGLFSFARERLVEALHENPSAVDLHRRLVDLYYYAQTTHLLPEQYEEFSGAADTDPVVAWYCGYGDLLAGDAARKEQRYHDAVTHYRAGREWFAQAVTLEASYATNTERFMYFADMGIGWCRLRERDFERASAIFLQALDNYPDLREEKDGIGKSLLDAIGLLEADVVNSQQFAMVLPLARKIAELEETDASWFNNLGFFLREHATQVLTRIYPFEGDIAARARELYAESWEAYRKAAEYAPDNARIVNDAGLIQAYHLRTDLTKAVEMFHQAIEVGEAQLADMDENTPESERYDVALAVGDAWQNLAYLEFSVNMDMEAAKEYFTKSMASNSGPRPAVQAYLDAMEGKGEAPPDAFEMKPPQEPAAIDITRVPLQSKIRWEPSFNQARLRAEQENRPLFVYYRPTGLAEVVAPYDRFITMPEFVRVVEDVVCVIADPQRYTFMDRAYDGTPIYSLRYGKVTCGEHVLAAEEFLAFWKKNRSEGDPIIPEEEFYYFTPEGERIELEGFRDLREFFKSIKEKAGEPRNGLPLVLLKEQIVGNWAPQRNRGAELLVNAPGRPARDLMEKLLFDNHIPAPGRAALVGEIAKQEDEYHDQLLKALIRQDQDEALAVMALDAWPERLGTNPVSHAFNWTTSELKKKAAVNALKRVKDITVAGIIHHHLAAE